MDNTSSAHLSQRRTSNIKLSNILDKPLERVFGYITEHYYVFAHQVSSSHGEPPRSVCVRPLRLLDCNHEYRRSDSVAVIEGRRSGDGWIMQGDATDGKSKLSWALPRALPYSPP